MCMWSAVHELAKRRASTLKQLDDRTKQCDRKDQASRHELLLVPLFFLSLSILQGRRDLNPQPPVLETGTLPIELLPSV